MKWKMLFITLTILLLVGCSLFDESTNNKSKNMSKDEKSQNTNYNLCECPEEEVPICEYPYVLSVKTYKLDGCNEECFKQICVLEKKPLNETLVFEAVKEYNYEDNLPVSAKWKKGEILTLNGSDIYAEFLLVEDEFGYEAHYCPVYLEYNGSLVYLKTFNLCFIDHEDKYKFGNRHLLIQAILFQLGFDLNYDYVFSRYEPISNQIDSYNELYAKINSTSSFVSIPMSIIDVKYDLNSIGKGCHIYEAHLFLKENFSILTGDNTYKVCKE